MKMNNIFVKLLVSILIVLTLVNFIGSININMNYSFADTSDPDGEGEERTNSLLDKIVSGIVGGIVNAFKTIVLAPFRAARTLNYNLASAGRYNRRSSTRRNYTFRYIF